MAIHSGHILIQQPDNCVTALTWTPEGKRKRGMPKTTWRRTVEKERSKAGWQSWREVRTEVQDRNRWRAHVEALCANLAPGDKWSEVCVGPKQFTTISLIYYPSNKQCYLARLQETVAICSLLFQLSFLKQYERLLKQHSKKIWVHIAGMLMI